MAEATPETKLLQDERIKSGTAWTRNEFFEKNGYVIIKDLWDPEELYHPVPRERGLMHFYGSLDKFAHNTEEGQVPGSLARYYHPQYKTIHSGIRQKLEKEIGRKLYNTYYYDRFYFPGQPLIKHTDRDACEISVTVNISTNLKEEWPIWIKTPDTYTNEKRDYVLVPGEERSVVLDPGDGMLYKGCERPHWRDPMPGTPVGERKKGLFAGKQKEELYYHQIFFHYVLQDGNRAQCAWDKAR